MLSRCFFTVLGEMNRLAPISLFCIRCANRTKISSSRFVRGSTRGWEVWKVEVGGGKSISEAERFNHLLEEKGRSFTDRFGVVKPSDLAKQEASHRATAVSCLNKLQQVLGEE